MIVSFTCIPVDTVITCTHHTYLHAEPQFGENIMNAVFTSTMTLGWNWPCIPVPVLAGFLASPLSTMPMR